MEYFPTFGKDRLEIVTFHVLQLSITCIMKTKLLCISLFCVGLAVLFRLFVYEFTFLNNVFKYKINEKPLPTIDKSGIFTSDTLKEFNGIIRKELYLAILGVVYDVSKAEKHYGPGNSYHIFAGKDASKSFINGNFNEGETSDDISDLTPNELLTLKQWKSFYDREYVKKGILVGRYYDDNGNPTDYFDTVEKLFENAEKIKSEKESDENEYPPCNIEWNADSGTRVWCTEKSGGVHRNWVGYPRKYFKPGSVSFRCACILDMQDPNVQEYENCSFSDSCYINT